MIFRIFGWVGASLSLLIPVSGQQVVSYLIATAPVTAATDSATNWSKPLALPAFDEALGTLTQVKLTLTGTVRQSLQLENLAGADGRFGYTLTTVLALNLGASNLFATTSTAAAGSVALGRFDGVRDFSGASGFELSRTGTSVETRIESGAATLAGFVGSGTLGFLATATSTAAVEGSGNFLSLAASRAAITLELDYTYTPIPEPKGYAVLIGVIGFGLVLLGRSRKSKAAGGNEADVG